MGTRPGVRLPRAPAGRDAIVWSDDYEIAVSCEDSIEVLIPNLDISIPLRRHGETDVEAEKWQTVRLVVNQFNDPKELRLLVPSSFDILSIGEEQSPSTVIALEWSPVGLGQFGRCALAVLTSNLVLSIWAHDGNPTVASRWKRVLIVNPALSLLESSSASASSRRTPPSQNDHKRTCARIRSFSWSPSLKQPTNASRKDCDSAFIAIANDLGAVCVCEIRSPFVDPLNPQPRWTAQALFNINTPFNPTPSPSTFSGENAARHLAWSPWVDTDTPNPRTRSCLSFAVNKQIWLANFVLDNDKPSRPKISVVGDSVPLKEHPVGPTRWAYLPTHGNTLIVASVNEKLVLTAVTFRKLDDGLNLIKSQSGSNCSWNGISGLSFGRSGSELKLFMVNDLAVKDPTPLAFTITPLYSAHSLVRWDWCTMMKDLRQVFQDTIKTHPEGTIFQCWGMSSTFTNDYVAVCASVKPKDVINHSRASERYSVCLVSSVSIDTPTPILTSSAEATCFSVGRYIRYRCGDDGKSATKIEAFQSWMETSKNLFVHCAEKIQNPQLQISTPAEAALFLRELFKPDKQALAYIQGTILLPIDGPIKPSFKVYPRWTLLRAVRKMPLSTFRSCRVSDLILRLYSQSEELTSQTWPIYFLRNPTETPLAELARDPRTFKEECRTCGAEIPFRDPAWGSCEKRHLFGRCGLTLLTIQEPGSSVSCGMCNARYITKEYLKVLDQEIKLHFQDNESWQGTIDDVKVNDEDVVAGDESVTTNTAPPTAAADANDDAEEAEMAATPPSLLDVLFAGCPTCIQCGGKFRVE